MIIKIKEALNFVDKIKNSVDVFLKTAGEVVQNIKGLSEEFVKISEFIEESRKSIESFVSKVQKGLELIKELSDGFFGDLNDIVKGEFFDADQLKGFDVVDHDNTDLQGSVGHTDTVE